jgi:hypothetical protein
MDCSNLFSHLDVSEPIASTDVAKEPVQWPVFSALQCVEVT